MTETSSPSSTATPTSSTSSSKYALIEPQSYQADQSSTPSSASDFEFSEENAYEEPIEPEYPINLRILSIWLKNGIQTKFNKRKVF